MSARERAGGEACRSDRAATDALRGRPGSAVATAAACGLLLAAAAVVFGQTVRYEFINFDDDIYVYANEQVLAGLTARGAAWAFTQFDKAAEWVPLTWLSLMADAQLAGGGAGRPDLPRLAGEMHAMNVALHAAAAVVLFLVLARMTVAVWRPALVAAVFAVHPLHVESVAWVTERKDVLSALFGFLAIGAYLWYVKGTSLHPLPLSRRERGVRFPWIRYLTVAAVLALGLMAKPVLATWPLVFLVLDYWPLRRWGLARGRERGGAEKGRDARATRNCRIIITTRKKCFRTKKRPILSKSVQPAWFCSRPADRDQQLSDARLGEAAVGGAGRDAAAVTFAGHSSRGAVASLEAAPISERLARAAMEYAGYLGKSVWPAGLAAMYRAGPVAGYWPAAAAAAVLALITAAAIWGAKRGQPWLAAGWLFYLITLLPMVGLVQAGVQVMPDRSLYLPQIGLSIALVWGIAGVAGRWRQSRVVVPGVAALILAVLAARSWQQASYWRDSETLWRHTLECTPDSAVAHNHLGLALAAHGQLDEAIEHYERAIVIKPDYTVARFNLGLALDGRGRVVEAIEQYRKGLEFQPRDAEAHYRLACDLLHHGEVPKAIRHFGEAVKIRPEYTAARLQLALLLATMGDLDGAIRQYEIALKYQPENAAANFNLGTALERRGRPREALDRYRTALRLASAASERELADAIAPGWRDWRRSGLPEEPTETITVGTAGSGGRVRFAARFRRRGRSGRTLWPRPRRRKQF